MHVKAATSFKGKSLRIHDASEMWTRNKLIAIKAP
jgi:hypothetical protein